MNGGEPSAAKGTRDDPNSPISHLRPWSRSSVATVQGVQSRRVGRRRDHARQIHAPRQADLLSPVRLRLLRRGAGLGYRTTSFSTIWPIPAGIPDYPDAEVRLLPATASGTSFRGRRHCSRAWRSSLARPRRSARAACCGGCWRGPTLMGFTDKAGFEFEFFVFEETPKSVREKGYRDLTPLSARATSAIR